MLAGVRTHTKSDLHPLPSKSRSMLNHVRLKEYKRCSFFKFLIVTNKVTSHQGKAWQRLATITCWPMVNICSWYSELQLPSNEDLCISPDQITHTMSLEDSSWWGLWERIIMWKERFQSTQGNYILEVPLRGRSLCPMADQIITAWLADCFPSAQEYEQ